MLQVIHEVQHALPDLTLHLGLVKLGKAYQLLVSDQASYGVGTVVLGAPPSGFQARPVASSSALFGLKHNPLAMSLTRRAAMKLEAPVLLLYHVVSQKKTKELAPLLVKALNEFLEEIGQKEAGSK